MIELHKLLKKIKVQKVIGDQHRFVEGLHYDSRQIDQNFAFVAIRGQKFDGHNFIDQAIANGATVLFVERPVTRTGATVIVVSNTRKIMAILAAKFYHEPNKKLKLVGITGTNGKTTTAYLIYSILREAHWNPGLISTIESFDNDTWETAERTTPEAPDIFRLLSRIVANRGKSAVMEVSSHALILHRVDGLRFDAAVFTGLGRDHLDFHGNTENYFLAKQKLFENLNENQKVILNADDPFTQRIEKITEGEVFSFSMKRQDATVRHLAHTSTSEGMEIELQIPAGLLKVETHLLGNFNINNVMAAVATAISLGLHDKFIVEGIRKMRRVPGRCEYYRTPGNTAIYLDYAHTPDALRNILQAIWETRPEKLIVVFGAGGDRDKGKRPQMGKAAEDFADRIILTNDNPRSENPEVIIESIAEGIFDKQKLTSIPDRREAIMEALHHAGKNDAVLIAGKGHERYQEIAGKRIHFDDREIIKSFFEKNNWEISRLVN